MPAPKTPVATPITFSFNSGEIHLTSVIDPKSKQHLVTCDLCKQVIKLGIRGLLLLFLSIGIVRNVRGGYAV